ncbi:MAG: hypothetical protein IM638_09530 [Bacteroidetes bacterium]|nr:hypothetical protein [Bacteroidota bacterium]
MKKIPQLLALGIFCITLLSFAAGTGGSTTAGVSKKGFSINKILVSSNWQIAPLLNELGAPDSVFVGFNKLHIYKKKGIVIFEKKNGEKPSGTVSEVQFFLDRNVDDNIYNLSDNYTGALKAGKLNLIPGLSGSVAKAKLKKWKISDSYAENSYRFANYGVYLYLMFNKEETRLMKVSIGKDTK